MQATPFDEVEFFRAIERRAELEDADNRVLSPEEFDARANAPWTPQEIEDFDALVHWFRTRYPTAGERLRAIRNRMIQLRRRGLSAPR